MQINSGKLVEFPRIQYIDSIRHVQRLDIFYNGVGYVANSRKIYIDHLIHMKYEIFLHT